MRLSFLIFLVILGVGCHKSSTQLVVVIDTDYDVPGEMGQVRVRTLSAEGAEVSTHDFNVVSSNALLVGTEVHIPFSFAVIPQSGDANHSLTLEVEARSSSGTLLSTRRVATGFIKHRSLFLSVFLPKSCANITCPTGETCTDAGCVNEIVDPNTLPSVKPGQEIDGAVTLRDAGALDGGATSDGGESDSGILGCPSTCGADCNEVQCGGGLCECTDHCYCLLQCTGSTNCSTRCRGTSCTVDAKSSASADINCGRDSQCTVLGTSTSGLRIDCGDNSVCDVDCRNSSGCHLACDGNQAQCLLRCSSAAGCMIDSCSSNNQHCGGNVFVCGRNCP